MNTSLSITKKIVSTSKRAESPVSGLEPPPPSVGMASLYATPDSRDIALIQRGYDGSNGRSAVILRSHPSLAIRRTMRFIRGPNRVGVKNEPAARLFASPSVG